MQPLLTFACLTAAMFRAMFWAMLFTMQTTMIIRIYSDKFGQGRRQLPSYSAHAEVASDMDKRRFLRNYRDILLTLRFPQSYENCINAIGGINQKKKVIKNNGKLSKKEWGYAACL